MKLLSFIRFGKNLLERKFSFFFVFCAIFSLAIFSANHTVFADITTGLTAYYALDESAGTMAIDSSGNNFNGSLFNGPAWTVGRLGNALNFDGVNDYVALPRINNSQLSLSLWFYRNAVDAVNQDFLYGGASWPPLDASKEGYALRFLGASSETLVFHLATTNGSAKTARTATYVFPASTSINDWHHAVGTYDSSTGVQSLFIDGQLRNTQTHPAGNTIVPLTSLSDMRIGNVAAGIFNGYWNGLIDDIRIYSRVLSAADITELYNYAGASSSSSSSSSASITPPAPRRFGVGVSFMSPTEPLVNLYWRAPTASPYILQNYEIVRNVIGFPISIATTTRYYVDNTVRNNNLYIYQLWAVYEGGYRSQVQEIIIRVPSAQQCQCGLLASCPYEEDAANGKYVLNFRAINQEQLYLPDKATTSVVPLSLISGKYKVRLVSAYKNDLGATAEITDLLSALNNKWYVSLQDGAGVEIERTIPSTKFSDYNTTPYYAYKNEIVNGSLIVPNPTSGAQGVWTGSTNPDEPEPQFTFSQVNAICAYFEKVGDLLSSSSSSSASSSPVRIIEFLAFPNPVDNSNNFESELSWKVENATDCTASGGWTGSKNNISGIATTTVNSPTTFTLECQDLTQNPPSSDTKSVTVNINTFDNERPFGYITINNGDASTNATAVTLRLSATDNIGVTGYYVSDLPTVPITTQSGWVSLTSATDDYLTNIAFNLSSSEGSKTVYAWYKDVAGNVSEMASDEINLLSISDNIDPTVAISSPPPPTYSTTQSTVNISGTASDNVGVTSVSWSNSPNNTSGTEIGTTITNWSVANISLDSGVNTITVTARDATGNTGADAIDVTYTPLSNLITVSCSPQWPNSPNLPATIGEIVNWIVSVSGGEYTYEWTGDVITNKSGNVSGSWTTAKSFPTVGIKRATVAVDGSIPPCEATIKVIAKPKFGEF